MTPVRPALAKLRGVRLHENLLRFAFGAGISVVAGLVALDVGLKIGGVFLAFPAILPASLTLIEHKDGRGQAVEQAWGAAMGGAGLVAFAIVGTAVAGAAGAGTALAAASGAWLVAALSVYVTLRWLARRRRPAR